MGNRNMSGIARKLPTLAKRIISRSLKKVMGRAIILLYHRVKEGGVDPLLLRVRPKHFCEHLEVLRRHYRVLCLADLVDGLSKGVVPNKAVAITFDDGYVDNLLFAKPLLEKFAMHATVFITTGNIDRPREFWWNELEQLLLFSEIRQNLLSVEVAGKQYEWVMGEDSLDPTDIKSRFPNWSILAPEDLTSRHRAYRHLHALLRPLAYEQRESTLDNIRDQVFDSKRVLRDRWTLTSEEIRNLATGGLIEIGAHTVTHPVLSALPVPEQINEIHSSKSCLEELTGNSITGFSYPYGSKSDYSLETVDIVKEAGFGYVCANFAHVVWRRTDHYQMPRFLVRDWNGEEFKGRLETWIRG